MEALITDSPIVPGLITEYILKGKDALFYEEKRYKTISPDDIVFTIFWSVEP